MIRLFVGTNNRLVHLLQDREDNGTELVVCLLHGGVDNHVRESHFLGRLDLLDRVLQTKLDALLGVRSAATETAFQLLVGGGLDKHEVRLHAGLHHLLHALDIDIQNADLLLVHHLHDAVERGSVDVAVHVRVLDELSLGNLLLHGGLVNEVIVHLRLTTEASPTPSTS